LYYIIHVEPSHFTVVFMPSVTALLFPVRREGELERDSDLVKRDCFRYRERVSERVVYQENRKRNFLIAINGQTLNN